MTTGTTSTAAGAAADGPAPRRAAVVVVSNRSAAGTREDRSGPVVRDRLRAAGFVVDEPVVVPDGAESVEQALRAALATGARLVVTSGGTGVTPTDRTPEGTRPLLARELPGIAERLRHEGAAHLPTAVLSRGLAGVTEGGALVVNLPGSPAGAAEGLDVLLPIAEHVLDQTAGGDHVPGDGHVPPDTGTGPASHGHHHGHAGAPRTTAADVGRGGPLNVFARLDDRPLDLTFHVEHASGPKAGAVATFVGQVRDHDPSVEGTVVALEYSAHPDAEAVLVSIAERIAADPEVLGVAVSHRVGRLVVGEAAIVAAVSAAHRGDAFDACRTLVETVKAELPVWKREVLDDGSHVWVGL